MSKGAKARAKTKPRAAAVSSSSNLVTRQQLAGLMQVNAFTVTKWQRDGLPVAERGRAGVPARYDLTACLAWRAAREATKQNTGGMSLADERAKLARVQTEIGTIKARHLRGELLEASDVAREWSNIVAAVRAKLLAIPRAAADRCFQEAAAGPAAVERVLRDVIYQALRELAAQGAEPPPAAAVLTPGEPMPV